MDILTIWQDFATLNRFVSILPNCALMRYLYGQGEVDLSLICDDLGASKLQGPLKKVPLISRFELFAMSSMQESTVA